MLRKPDLAMVGSIALYFAARQFEWNLPSFPDGDWYFNPFCWQLLFVFGAWLALGGGAKYRSSILESPTLLYFGIAYLVFAFVMTMAGRFPEFGNLFPRWLFDAFNPNDKDKSRALSRAAFRRRWLLGDAICAEGLARTSMADLQAADHMRPAIARGILRRGLPLLCRPFRADDGFGFADGADFRERRPGSPS